MSGRQPPPEEQDTPISLDLALAIGRQVADDRDALCDIMAKWVDDDVLEHGTDWFVDQILLSGFRRPPQADAKAIPSAAAQPPPPEDYDDAFCLAHSHADRTAEAICSLRFQRDALRADLAEAKVVEYGLRASYLAAEKHRRSAEAHTEAAVARAEKAELDAKQWYASLCAECDKRAAAEAERDRYRTALQSIRDYTEDVPNYIAVHMAMLAGKALSSDRAATDRGKEGTT
jgi:hypothetical protein